MNKSPDMDKRYEFVKKLSVFLFFFILLIYAFSEAEKFFSVIFLAVLFSYLLFPIAGFLERHSFPRILSILVAIIFGLLVLTGIIFFFSKQITVFTQDFPRLRTQAILNINKLEQWTLSVFGVSPEVFKTWLQDTVSGLLDMSGNFLRTVFTATTSTLVRFFLMPVFVFFMLYYRNKFHDFIMKMVKDEEREKTETIIKEVNTICVRYMTGVFTVVLILSVLHSVALGIIGLEYAVLLGVTAAIFNFIPYFGTLIGAVFPLLYSMVATDSMSYTLWVLIYFLIIQFVENNILTPKITGGIVSLNPFVTILSLIFGSMIWGIVGMFLVIPYTAMFRVYCEHIPYLKPVAFLLSDRGTEEYALTGKKILKIFRKERSSR